MPFLLLKPQTHNQPEYRCNLMFFIPTHRLFFKVSKSYRPLRSAQLRCSQSSSTSSDQSSGARRRPGAVSGLRPSRDLVHFRRSRFVAHCNELRRCQFLPKGVCMDPPTRLSVALTTAGRTHEDRVVEHLIAAINHTSPSYNVPFAHRDRYLLTQQAILRRVPFIRGAALSNDVLDGYADLLILSQVDPFLSPSQRQQAHPNAYSVCEVKLATVHRSDHILQAASYFCMLNKLLNQLDIPSASHAYLWLGNVENEPIKLPARSLEYLFSSTASRYSQFLKTFDPLAVVMPDGLLDDMAPWKTYATQLLESADSLRLIAGIRQSQVSQIVKTADVKTISRFAALPSEEVEGLISRRKLPPLVRRLHRQAFLQLKTRHAADRSTAFEVLPDILQVLPPTSPSDAYFDMEGFPLMQEGGLEYLFGIRGATNQNFRVWWAHTREQEERAFISLVNWVHQRIRTNQHSTKTIPHVFHYGHYEVTALRRIAMRAVTDEGMHAAMLFQSLVDQDVFFDIYKFVKSSLIIGESSYSIKKVEKLVGISREGDNLADAESSIGMYFEWRRQCFEESIEKFSVSDELTHPILNDLFKYNKQDCDSLAQVVDWLRIHISRKVPTTATDDTLISEEEDSGGKEEFMPGACGRTKELRMVDSAAIARCCSLSETLLTLKSPYLSTAATQSLAHLLQFYAKESAPDRRLFRERVEIASTPQYEDLFNDDKCVIGVRLTGVIENPLKPEKKLFAYSFNGSQPAMLTTDENMAFVVPSRGGQTTIEGGDKQVNISLFVTVKFVDVNDGKGKGRLMLSVGNKRNMSPPRFGVLVSSDDLKVCDAPLRQSLLRKAEELGELEKCNGNSLARAFLNRNTIVEDGPREKEWVQRFSSGEFCSESLGEFLDSRRQNRIFIIQGPPGTGKTFLSGQLISQLITKHQKTVAVTSNSHAAIDNLLRSAVIAGVDSDKVWKVGTRATGDSTIRFKPNVRDLSISPLTGKEEETMATGQECSTVKTKTKETSKRKRSNDAVLVGATCYQLCREENDDKFDFLFIDEASQVTMAHFLAVSSSAKYAVLAGDQQQLEMPIKGAHFGTVGRSCLAHIVGEDVTTVSPERGIFLGTSYRMNPSICKFISDSFYDGALAAAPVCRNNAVLQEQAGEFDSMQFHDGICFLSCRDGVNDGTRDERSSKWNRPREVDTIREIVCTLLGAECIVKGDSKRLQESDFLVVAPYNAQVRALRAALPDGVRVGTVDKFQGQEAPVAIISTCTSEDGNAVDEDNDDFGYEQDFSGFGEEIADGNGIELMNGGGSDHRGVRFCLQKNRLNVALSRAQCLAVVVGDRDACVKLPLTKLDDIDTAVLFEHLVGKGHGS